MLGRGPGDALQHAVQSFPRGHWEAVAGRRGRGGGGVANREWNKSCESSSKSSYFREREMNLKARGNGTKRFWWVNPEWNREYTERSNDL